MKRRELIRWVCGAAVTVPVATRAQQPRPIPVIGLLSIASPAPFANLVAALRQGLQDTGYVEGQNLDVEFRWAEGHFDRLAPLAADLVSRQVAVIVATGGPAPRSPPRPRRVQSRLYSMLAPTRSGWTLSPASTDPGEMSLE